MTRIWTYLLIAIVICLAEASSAAPDRTRLPGLFYNGSIGLTVGVSDFPFAMSHLQNGFTARSVETRKLALRGHLEHNLRDNLALRISLMRPIEWLNYEGIDNQDTKQSIRLSIFGLTLKPSIPLSERWVAHGEAGLAYFARNGISFGDVEVISSFETVTFLAGGGLDYNLSGSWHLDLDLSYTPAMPSRHQPYSLFAGAGMTYCSGPQPARRDPGASDMIQPPGHTVPLNLVQLSFYDRDVMYWDVTKYFTPPNIPIFWKGDVKTQRGLAIFYQRNFFHTERWFSLEWGACLSSWSSRGERQAFQAVSVFPALTFWIIREPAVDCYFTYSVAGPAYLSQRTIDGIDTGQRFTFQDFLGVGAYVGSSKHLNLSLRILHFSNGNIFTENPGVAVPVMMGLGYGW